MTYVIQGLHRNWTIKFNDFPTTNLNFPWLRNAENPAFWGHILLDDMENVSSFQTARNIWIKNEILWFFHDLNHFS